MLPHLHSGWAVDQAILSHSDPATSERQDVWLSDLNFSETGSVLFLLGSPIKNTENGKQLDSAACSSDLCVSFCFGPLVPASLSIWRYMQAGVVSFVQRYLYIFWWLSLLSCWVLTFISGAHTDVPVKFKESPRRKQ